MSKMLEGLQQILLLYFAMNLIMDCMYISVTLSLIHFRCVFFANCLLFLWIFDEKKWFSALETGNFLYKESRHCTLTHIISTPIGKMKFVHSGNKIT